MDIDKNQAQESLNAVQETMERAGKSIASSEASPMLILWGGVWVVAYTFSHFYLQHVVIIMWSMSLIGGIGSLFIIKQHRSKATVKSKSPNNLSRKVGWMWFFVFLYLSIWMFVLQPFNGLQMNAAIVIAVMFAYVIMGLWFNSRFLLVLGLSITVTTLIGYAVLTPYYCLWMAATGGLALLLTGIIMRLKWR